MVIPVDVEILQNEPWTTTCALVVVPGGADQHYCTSLNGVGNRRLQSYVRQGGSYLGFCAGGYYGSSRCEFEAANQKMAVVGNRELAFFPGVCRGLVFPGFDYRSEAGARAARLNVLPGASSGEVHGPEYFHSYYNGGGVFVDAETYRDQGVEVLATYSDQPSVDCGKIAAAVVNCKIGEGKVILTGPHIECVLQDRPKRDADDGLRFLDSQREICGRTVIFLDTTQ